MNEDEHIIKEGPLKRKRIELASTVGIELFDKLAQRFMLRIFEMEASDYLITDESTLHDFIGVADLELADIYQKVLEVYGIDVSDVQSGQLLEIFVRIHERNAESA
jgi:hypothetical protein